jgi:uncharacterized protein YegJ (DUF2314 family)
VEGDRAEGELINEPLHLVTPKKGDVIWVSKDQVSDWTVVTPEGQFEPHQTAALENAVRRLRG